MAHIDRWSPTPVLPSVCTEYVQLTSLSRSSHAPFDVIQINKRCPTSSSSPTRPFRKKIRFGLRCTAYLCSTYSYSQSTTMSPSVAVQRRVGVLDGERYIQSEWPVRGLKVPYIFVKKTYIIEEKLLK